MVISKSTIPFLLFGILLSIMSSCKEKDCHKTGECQPEYYRIRLGEAKNYLYALPGSYWIYKNTSTGDLDTQVCTGFEFDSVIVKGTEPYSKQVTVEYDVIQRWIESSFNGYEYFDQTGNHNPNGMSYNNGVTKVQRTGTGPGVIGPFIYPFETDLESGNGSSTTKVLGFDSTMTIQGKSYFIVAKFDIDMDDLFINYPHTIYYWAKGVGLVKRWDKTNSNNWELTEYKIIQ